MNSECQWKKYNPFKTKHTSRMWWLCYDTLTASMLCVESGKLVKHNEECQINGIPATMEMKLAANEHPGRQPVANECVPESHQVRQCTAGGWRGTWRKCHHRQATSALGTVAASAVVAKCNKPHFYEARDIKSAHGIRQKYHIKEVPREKCLHWAGRKRAWLAEPGNFAKM